jgi:hypothetical protein
MTYSPSDRLSRTAMSLAVLAIFSILSFPVVAPYILGSLSLVLAVLSKGGSEVYPRRSKIATIVAIVALVLNTLMLVYSVIYFNRVLHDPVLQEQFSQTLYRMYGMTLEEFLGQYGIPQ